MRFSMRETLLPTSTQTRSILRLSASLVDWFLSLAFWCGEGGMSFLFILVPPPVVWKILNYWFCLLSCCRRRRCKDTIVVVVLSLSSSSFRGWMKESIEVLRSFGPGFAPWCKTREWVCAKIGMHKMVWIHVTSVFAFTFVMYFVTQIYNVHTFPWLSDTKENSYTLPDPHSFISGALVSSLNDILTLLIFNSDIYTVCNFLFPPVIGHGVSDPFFLVACNNQSQ